MLGLKKTLSVTWLHLLILKPKCKTVWSSLQCHYTEEESKVSLFKEASKGLGAQTLGLGYVAKYPTLLKENSA